MPRSLTMNTEIGHSIKLESCHRPTNLELPQRARDLMRSQHRQWRSDGSQCTPGRPIRASVMYQKDPDATKHGALHLMGSRVPHVTSVGFGQYCERSQGGPSK